jgi:hypothetical protein
LRWQTGEPERATALLDEAASVAVEAGAHGTLHWIDVARAQRGQPLA